MTELATYTEADPFTSSLAGRRLGRYEVLARLASGGMAGVYVARAVGVAGFERLFAIKVLHPHLAHEEEFITMFLDEARLAARIRHPNVVPTIDISDTADAGYYLVMDYIEGDHLGALLQHAFKAGGRLPTPVALRIVLDALQGLGAAHALTDPNGQPLHLVHRDVSPHNIMVSTDGVARITDFGVAKAASRLGSTQEGQFKGKLAYMAPEHASQGQSDQRSDLFAMAIILWETTTGRRLFRAENHAATLNRICLEPIPMPSAVDPALAPFDAILAKGLARDPNERFQTAEEFAEAIESNAEALGGLANQRVVARLVTEFAADKLARDRQLVRSAIESLGSARGTPPVTTSVSSRPPVSESSQPRAQRPDATHASRAAEASGAATTATGPVQRPSPAATARPMPGAGNEAANPAGAAATVANTRESGQIRRVDPEASRPDTAQPQPTQIEGEAGAPLPDAAPVAVGPAGSSPGGQTAGARRPFGFWLGTALAMAAVLIAILIALEAKRSSAPPSSPDESISAATDPGAQTTEATKPTDTSDPAGVTSEALGEAAPKDSQPDSQDDAERDPKEGTRAANPTGEADGSATDATPKASDGTVEKAEADTPAGAAPTAVRPRPADRSAVRRPAPRRRATRSPGADRQVDRASATSAKKAPASQPPSPKKEGAKRPADPVRVDDEPMLNPYRR